ncbi:hypothetical protein [Pseudoclavibacter helvolus]|uniref:hypothetical protein n=1 Tax=Pseudoclavibacter helvolus TaxID=255205 RepID=UPI0012E73FD0|nr:hypothetical protein [Pseudoclavibacter helvolus]
MTSCGAPQLVTLFSSGVLVEHTPVSGSTSEPIERVVTVLSAIGDMIARANGH